MFVCPYSSHHYWENFDQMMGPFGNIRRGGCSRRGFIPHRIRNYYVSVWTTELPLDTFIAQVYFGIRKFGSIAVLVARQLLVCLDLEPLIGSCLPFL